MYWTTQLWRPVDSTTAPVIVLGSIAVSGMRNIHAPRWRWNTVPSGSTNAVPGVHLRSGAPLRRAGGAAGEVADIRRVRLVREGGARVVTDAFRVLDARSRAARAIEYDWPGDRAVIRIS